MRIQLQAVFAFVLFIVVGNSSAQMFTHEADPVGKLQEYAMFATDTIIMGDQAGAAIPEGQGLWFPKKGYVGTNGDFLMKNLPGRPGTYNFFDKVFVGNTLELNQWPENNRRYICSDTFYVRGNVVNNNSHNIIIDQATPFEDPVVSSDEWYKKWTADDIVISPSAGKKNSAVVVEPGDYDSVIVRSGMSFKSGVYNIRVLKLAGRLVIDKEPSQYCRIFVRDEILFGTGSQEKSIRTITNLTSDQKVEADPSLIRDSLPSDFGKVLLYTTAKKIETNRSAANSYAPQIEASIVAPRCHIVFNNYPIISGQLLARKLEFQGDFDARNGEFVPWVSANISVATTTIYEDTLYKGVNLDKDVSSADAERESKLPGDTIKISLANALNETATIKYQIVKHDSLKGDLVYKDGVLTFKQDELVPNPPLVIKAVDDNDYDPDESFTLRLYGNSTPADKIVLSGKAADGTPEQLHVITIDDDDPEFEKPDSIGSTAELAVYENQYEVTASGDTVGREEVAGHINIADVNGNNNHTLTIIDGTGKDIFKIRDLGNNSGYELFTTTRLDYETVTSYTVKIRAQDKNGIADDFIETAMLTVSVLPVNDVPAVAVVDSFKVEKGGTVQIDSVMLLANDSDGDDPADGNDWYVTQTTDGTHGTVAVNGAGFLYRNDGENGVKEDIFYYSLGDSVTYTYPAEKGVRIHNQENIGKVVITIDENYDQKPVVQSGKMTVLEAKGSAASIVILDSLATDPDLAGGDVLTLTYEQPAFGTVTPASPITLTEGTTITYTYSSEDSVEEFADVIKFTVKDKSGKAENSLSAEIAISITALNDNPPEQTIDVVTVPYGKVSEITVLPDLWSDYDIPVLRASIDSTIPSGIKQAPKHGNIVAVTDSTFLFTPDVNDNTINTTPGAYQDTIVYQILDSVDYHDTSHRVMDTVYIIFDESSKGLPIANDDELTVDEGGTVVSTFSIRDNDEKGVSGADLGKVLLAEPAQFGKVTITEDGIVTYIHDGSENFADVFTYTVSDMGAIPKTSFPGKVKIVINPLNDNEPQVSNITDSVFEGKSVTIAADKDLIDSSIATAGHYPDINTVWDISLKGVNGGAKCASSVTIDPVTYELIYTHNGEDTAAYDTVALSVKDVTPYDAGAVHDSTRLVIIAIRHLNDNPPVVKDSALTVLENGEGTIDLTSFIKDADGGALEIAINQNGATGVATNVGALFTYKNNGKGTEKFTDSFTYIVTDEKDALGNVNTVEGTITVTIIPQNDEIAVGGADKYLVEQAETLTVSAETGVLTNDSDDDRSSDPKYAAAPYGNILYVSLKDDVQRGILKLDSTGAFTYTYTPGDSIYVDTFTYVITDSTKYHEFAQTSEPVEVIITINPTPPTELDFLSVTYHDISVPSDGFIDQISVVTPEPVTDNFLSQLLEKIEFNGDRSFTIDDIIATDDGFDVLVTEGALIPNTAVSAKDLFTIKERVTYDGITMKERSVQIADRVAPVILGAAFGRYGVDSLKVQFSEPVNPITSLGDLYGFYQTSSSIEYMMNIAGSSPAGGENISHVVDSISVRYPVAGDSIRIDTANVAVDAAGNTTALSVWAPLKVLTPYDFGLELLIYPQPLELVKVDEVSVQPVPLEDRLIELYDLSNAQYGFDYDEAGISFLLESKGPLKQDLALHSGKAQIFDNTGNAVTEVTDMVFVVKETGDVAGVVLWDGKNIQGRISGRGSYMIAVEVTVVTDEGENSREINKQFIKTIGVKQ